MFRVGFRYIKSQVDTEDVLITAFTKVYSGINKFTYQGEGSLPGWIKKIVINEAFLIHSTKKMAPPK